MPKSEEQCREKLKEMFLNNKHVSDIRVIDMLVIKVKLNKVLIVILENFFDFISINISLFWILPLNSILCSKDAIVFYKTV